MIWFGAIACALATIVWWVRLAAKLAALIVAAATLLPEARVIGVIVTLIVAAALLAKTGVIGVIVPLIITTVVVDEGDDVVVVDE